MRDFISDLVQRVVEQENALIEQACRDAHAADVGVILIRSNLGALRFAGTSRFVPAGQLYEIKTDEPMYGVDP